MTDGVVHWAYFAGHALTTLLTAAIGFWFVSRSELQSRMLFGVLFGVGAFWSALSSVSLFIDTPHVQIGIYGVKTVCSIAVGFLLLASASAFVGRKWYTDTIVRTAGLVFVVLVIAIITTPFHDQYWTFVMIQHDPFPHVHAGYGPLRIVAWVYNMAIALVVIYYFTELQLKSRHQQSTALLVLALGIAVSLAIYFLSELFLVETYNHSPFVLPVAAIVYGYAAFRFDLGTLAPIARDVAIEDFSDPFFVVNDAHQLVDFNPAAARLVEGLTEEQIGEPLSTVAPAIATQVPLEDPDETSPTAVIEDDSGTRYFDVNCSSVHGLRGDRQGTQILLRDITALREQEQELEMLKQVFSRVFRHNVRNELSIVQGQLDLIELQAESETVDDLTVPAKRATDRLLGHTTKAREIERVLDDSELTVQSLSELVSTAIEVYRETPDVSVRTAVDDVPVRVVSRFHIAIETAIENAIEHNPKPVTIDVCSERHAETVDLSIVDDGIGIPDHEIDVVTAEAETPLSHGSGVGLWLMKWYTEKSGGAFAVTATETGTEVRMTLPLRSERRE